MRLLSPLIISAVMFGMMFLTMRRQNRERTANAPLRAEVQAGARFATRLDRVRVLGTGGVAGTRGQWISIRGPKRLVVAADAFMISVPQAHLHEFAFTGFESSIRFSQAPSRLVQRDWIVITGQASGREVQLAITKKAGLPEIWQALAGTGAAQDWGPPAEASG
jgi:hypothetical protein